MDSNKDNKPKNTTPPRKQNRFSFLLHPLEDKQENPFQEDLLPYLQDSLKTFFRFYFDDLYQIAGEADFSLYVEGALEKIERTYIKENKKSLEEYLKKHEKEKKERLSSSLLSSDPRPEEGVVFSLLSFPFFLYTSKGEKVLLIRVVPKKEKETKEELDNKVTPLATYLTYLTGDQMIDFLYRGIDRKEVLTHDLNPSQSETKRDIKEILTHNLLPSEEKRKGENV